MPMLLGAKGKDILQWRATADLVESFSQGLERKWGLSSGADAESFLGKVIGTLGDELDYEDQFVRETAALDEGIDVAGYDELPALVTRYREVVSAHFSRRRSVLALSGVCNRLHDRILSKALILAKERMLELGQGSPPVHALLVSGDRGRGEQTLFAENRYFLLHEEDSARFYLFSRQVATALKDLGLLTSEQMFWHGSLVEWRAMLGESFSLWRAAEQKTPAPPPFAPPGRPGPRDLPDWEWRLEALTDLCLILGYGPLAVDGLAAAARTVQEERTRAPFQQLARRVIALPLAISRFGKWRIQRDGEHQGEVNLEELALGPLVMTVRVLAVHEGVMSGGTLQRIESLLDRGALTVELADRLLKAYQCFMQLKIESEIRSEGAGAFVSLDELDEVQEIRFRNAVETVLNLQKIAYQRMAVMG